MEGGWDSVVVCYSHWHVSVYGQVVLGNERPQQRLVRGEPGGGAQPQQAGEKGDKLLSVHPLHPSLQRVQSSV